MITTKEQLLTSHTELQTKLALVTKDAERQEKDDYRLRSRFSAVLRARQSCDDRFVTSYAAANREPLSWEEIFCEVGKLLMCNYSEEWRKRIEGDLETLQNRIAVELQPRELVTRR